MKKFLLVCFFFSVTLASAMAQGREVSGKVTSVDDGSPLPGVNVVLKGTTNGTVTDANGSYTLSVPAEGGTLVFSFIGMATQEIAIGDRSSVDVTLSADDRQLNEVVVVAFGLEASKKPLGTSIATVTSGQIADTRQTNVVNALTAKVAGVRVAGSNGMVGSSSSIFIRGMTSFTQSNQPLFVIDGVPIDNGGGGNALQSGVSNSNRAIDINPDDIESMSVLKGPAAAVLYGSRAVSGAIIITTKKGANKSKGSISFTSNYNIVEVNRTPDMQNTYAQGNSGIYAPTALDSWGPKITGQTVTNYLGQPEVLTAYPNNVKDLFKQGNNIQNTVSFSGATDKSRYFVSYSNLQESGVLPMNELTRNTFKVTGSSQLTSKLNIEANANYINSVSQRTPQGNTQGNPLFRGWFLPRSFNLFNYPYQLANGSQSYFDTSTDNPYWSIYNNTYKDRLDRIIGSVKATYDFTDWLSASYQLGTDAYLQNIRQIDAVGSVGNASGATATGSGGMRDQNIFSAQTSSFLNINAKKTFGDISTAFLVGNEVTQTYSRSQGVFGTTASTSGFSQITSYTNYAPFNTENIRRLIGLYAQATVGYKDYLFLTVTGRNDWSSTFALNKNSYFYPGANMSFVFTDAFPSIKSERFLTFGKLRAAVVKVGREATLYSTDTYFGRTAPSSGFGPAITFPFRNQIGYELSDLAGNPNIKPEFTTSSEVGTELRFWKDRISVDFGYFQTRTTDIILSAPASSASGFSNQVRNAGELETNGFELTLGITPVQTGSFRWTIDANWSRIRNNVIKIDPLVTSIGLGGFTTPQTQLAAGQPYGVIVGNPFNRDANGNLLITATGPGAGQPTANTTQNVFIGNPNPDWTGGVTNTFKYKNLTLSFLLDLRVGGDVISRNIRDLRFRGVAAETGDRDRTYVIDGVLRDPVNNADGTPRALLVDGAPVKNTIELNAQAYWTSIYNTQGEAIVFDASWMRLRELSLTYDLPKTLLSKTPFGSASIVLTGRNLWLYAPNYPHLDPEVNSQGVSNSQGFEFNTLPQTRSYGVLVRLTF